MAKHVDDTRAYDQPTMAKCTGERSQALMLEIFDGEWAAEYMATRHG